MDLAACSRWRPRASRRALQTLPAFGDPTLNLVEAVDIEAVDPPLGLAAHADESRSAQHREVPGDAGRETGKREAMSPAVRS